MKKYFLFLISALLSFYGCAELNLDDVNGRLDNLEDRVSKLEVLCTELNTNISSLKAVVNALEKNDYVTAVTPIIENGVTKGYSITFAKYGPITIFNGENGKDGEDSGAAPKIGLRQFTDGIWYWTLNGEWLLDDEGNKVKASGVDGQNGKDGEDGKDGADGKDGEDGIQGEPGNPGDEGPQGPQGDRGNDGITPKLKIEDGYWYVSYDNGAKWERLGVIGDSETSGSTLNVTYDNDYVYIAVDSETTIKVPRSTGLDIKLSVKPGVAIVPGSTMKIEYEVVGGDDETLVRCPGVNEGLYAVVKPITPNRGDIYIVDNYDNDSNYDFLYDTMRSLLISVSNGKGESILKSLNINRGVLKSVTKAYMTGANAGIVEAEVQTNVDYSVYIPETVGGWLVYENTGTRTVRTDILQFKTSQNNTDKFRSAVVELRNKLDETLEAFTIIQEMEGAGNGIVFADAALKEACVAAFDTDGNGELSYREAASVTDLSKLMVPAKITSFNELEYFAGVTEIPEDMFSECYLLESIVLPETIRKIGAGAFYGCKLLKTLILPENLKELGYGGTNGIFENCTSLTDIVVPSSVVEIPYATFRNCASLISITLPERIEYIGSECFSDCKSLKSVDLSSYVINYDSDTYWNSMFSGCYSLEQVILPDGIESLGENVFENCSSLTSISIPYTITNLGDSCFRGCSSLSEIFVPENVTSIGSYAFADCQAMTTITLPDNLKTLGYQAFSGCTSLREITLPSLIKSLDQEMFAGCTSLEEATINSRIKELPNAFFAGCSALHKVILPEGLLTIGECAFGPANEWSDNCACCTSLTSLTLPSTVRTIGSRAFAGCSALAEIILPEGLLRIEDEAFASVNINDENIVACQSLKNLALPSSLTYIGREAFRGAALTGDTLQDDCMCFVIPENVEKISEYAFAECNGIEAFKILATTPPMIEWETFPEGTLFFVPASAENEYRNYFVWSELPLFTY